MITKAERTELKSIVRGQMKVLRAELEQRETELKGGVEDEIAARDTAAEEKWAVLQHEVHEAVMEANRAINDAIYKHGYDVKGPTERLWVTEPRMAAPDRGQRDASIRRHAYSRIAVQMKEARLRLDRQEADLLKTLAVGALESDEAQEFLAQIPTVGELVPTARLAELEASFEVES